MLSASVAHDQPKNRLLATLPWDVWGAIRPSFIQVRLVFGQVLIESGVSTEHVFFLEEGLVSLVADGSSNRPGVHVAMIGREGMVGGLALLGPASPAFASAVCQIPGLALRIPILELRGLLDHHAVLRSGCMQFVQSLTRQTMENAACNARYTLTERCVRWLLMADQRIEGSELSVTHEALAGALGVRRAGVTVVASTLQESGLIRANRGRITIVDRIGLERLLSDGSARPRRKGGAASPQHEAYFAGPVGSQATVAE